MQGMSGKIAVMGGVGGAAIYGEGSRMEATEGASPILPSPPSPSPHPTVPLSEPGVSGLRLGWFLVGLWFGVLVVHGKVKVQGLAILGQINIPVLKTCLVQNPDIPQAGHVGAHGGVAGRGRAGLCANRTVRLGTNPFSFSPKHRRHVA